MDDSTTKTAGVPLLEQNRSPKFKEILRALERDHPEMPVEMKARIASRKSKKNARSRKSPKHGGPAYKAPITHERVGEGEEARCVGKTKEQRRKDAQYQEKEAALLPSPPEGYSEAERRHWLGSADVGLATGGLTGGMVGGALSQPREFEWASKLVNRLPKKYRMIGGAGLTLGGAAGGALLGGAAGSRLGGWVAEAEVQDSRSRRRPRSEGVLVVDTPDGPIVVDPGPDASLEDRIAYHLARHQVESERGVEKEGSEGVFGSATREEAAQSVRRAGHSFEEGGRKMRNVGYGSAAAMLAGSFIPGVRGRNWARRALRGGAAVSGLGGYVGEGGIRSGKGYQLAADVFEGKKPAPADQSEVWMEGSPSAYRQALRALQIHAKHTPVSGGKAKPKSIEKEAGGIILGPAKRLKPVIQRELDREKMESTGGEGLAELDLDEEKARELLRKTAICKAEYARRLRKAVGTGDNPAPVIEKEAFTLVELGLLLGAASIGAASGAAAAGEGVGNKVKGGLAGGAAGLAGGVAGMAAGSRMAGSLPTLAGGYVGSRVGGTLGGSVFKGKKKDEEGLGKEAGWKRRLVREGKEALEPVAAGLMGGLAAAPAGAGAVAGVTAVGAAPGLYPQASRLMKTVKRFKRMKAHKASKQMSKTGGAFTEGFKKIIGVGQKAAKKHVPRPRQVAYPKAMTQAPRTASGTHADDLRQQAVLRAQAKIMGTGAMS